MQCHRRNFLRALLLTDFEGTVDKKLMTTLDIHYHQHIAFIIKKNLVHTLQKWVLYLFLFLLFPTMLLGHCPQYASWGY